MSDLIRRYDALKAVDMWESDWSRTDSAIRALPPVTIQAQIDAATLRKTLHDLIETMTKIEMMTKAITANTANTTGMTMTDDELVKRLRDGVRFNTARYEYEANAANADMKDAADRIEALTAEREDLVECNEQFSVDNQFLKKRVEKAEADNARLLEIVRDALDAWDTHNKYVDPNHRKGPAMSDVLATNAELEALRKASGIPYLPTQLTFEARLAIGGEGPRAYDWSDKPHRIAFDLCREIEKNAAIHKGASHDH